MKILHVLIAGDKNFREEIKTTLERQENMVLAGTAKNSRRAWEKIQKIRPDIIILDVHMPANDGINIIRMVKKKYPETKIIVIAAFDDDEHIIKSMASGADGFLFRNTGEEQLVESIRNAATGQLILPAEVAGKLVVRAVEYVQSATNNSSERQLGDIKLTPRETEVATLMTMGYTNRQISEQLDLTRGTAKNYVSRIYAKLGTGDRRQAIMLLECILR